jgi:hypothetical protein
MEADAVLRAADRSGATAGGPVVAVATGRAANIRHAMSRTVVNWTLTAV